MSKVTINIVAQHAGVSKKTVSRVLNNEPNVSPKTREKVLNTFGELGYRPSAQARGLASNQSFLIGLMYDNPNKSYVSDIQEGALASCDSSGYHLIIHPVDHESEELLTNVEQLLDESRLDGMVLTPPFSDMQSLLGLFDARKLPFVRIGATIMDSPAASVISNDQQAAYQMTRYLISLGHSDIGFIKGHPDHRVSEQRFEGYSQALQDAGIKLNQDYVQQGFFSFASGEDCGRMLLSLPQPPTAIFASNDYMAAGVIKVAGQRKVNIPHELSVAGFDNAPITRYIWPSMTTISQPIRNMAKQAVELLIADIKQAGQQERLAQLDAELVVRESTAPLNQG